MLIRTLDQVSGRTTDGRVYAAGQGATTLVDDDDAGMVALMRDLAGRGQVEILDEQAEADDQDRAAVERIQQSAEAKQARTPDAELDQLREQAAAAGITVDRRWGSTRLREEIDAAAGAPEVTQ